MAADGFDNLAGLAAAAARTLADPALFAQAAPALVPLAVAGVKENFGRRQGPDGSPWAPLKDPRARGRPPLVKTGVLRDSIRATVLSQEAGWIAVYSAVPYAGFQDRGTRTIPARTFLYLSEQVMERMAWLCAGYAASQVWGGK